MPSTCTELINRITIIIGDLLAAADTLYSLPKEEVSRVRQLLAQEISEEPSLQARLARLKEVL